jgi:hypothetical protein
VRDVEHAHCDHVGAHVAQRGDHRGQLGVHRLRVVRRVEGVVAAADDQRQVRCEGQRRGELGGPHLVRAQPASTQIPVRQLGAHGGQLGGDPVDPLHVRVARCRLTHALHDAVAERHEPPPLVPVQQFGGLPGAQTVRVRRFGERR